MMYDFKRKQAAINKQILKKVQWIITRIFIHKKSPQLKREKFLITLKILSLKMLFKLACFSIKIGRLQAAAFC